LGWTAELTINEDANSRRWLYLQQCKKNTLFDLIFSLNR